MRISDAFGLAVLVAAVAGTGLAARASSVTTTALITGTNAGATINGTAVFTLSDNGHLTIDLTNNVANPLSAGSLLGGITFTLSPTSAFNNVVPTNFSVSGNLIDVNLTADTWSNATAAQIAALGANTNWSESKGDPFTLKVTSGNDPLIIGAPNGSGLYTNANPSLGANHQPFYMNTAEFNMDIAGLTSGTVISNVNFMWGTTYTSCAATGITTTTQTGGQSAPTVPVPAAAWSGAAALMLGMGVVRGDAAEAGGVRGIG